MVEYYIPSPTRAATQKRKTRDTEPKPSLSEPRSASAPCTPPPYAQFAAADAMSTGWRTLLLRIGDRCPEYGGSADHKEHIVRAPPSSHPLFPPSALLALGTLGYLGADL